MNKKEYLKQIIDEGNYIIQQAQARGQYTIDISTGQRAVVLDKFSFDKWMTKTNSFLDKYGINTCKIPINGQPPSYILISKLAKVTALYESFLLDDDCLASLRLLPQNVKDLFSDEHYSQAVFEAFKYVEVRVKEKSNFTTLYGTDLMRKAFALEDKNKNQLAGPLNNTNLPKAEQQSQSDLFSGAIGFIKNPKSHNIINVNKDKATELLYFANYLLRILEEN